MAERSVQQARKAFEGFLAVAGRAVEAAEATQGGAKSIGAHVLAYTEQNANAAFDAASKLVRARDPQEALTLQSDYLKGQFAALQTQAKELGGVLQKSVAPGLN
jgi:phasin